MLQEDITAEQQMQISNYLSRSALAEQSIFAVSYTHLMADRVIEIKNSKVVGTSLNPHPTPVEQIEW